MVLLGLGLKVYSTTGTVGGVGSSSKTWYVSNSGNDVNSGRSEEQAFATISAVNSVMQSGDTVILATDSVWREKLGDDALDNVTITTSGSGDRPIITAYDIADNADFTVDSTFSNVYNISWVPEFGDGTQNSIHGVLVDGIGLQWVASKTICNTTPNSFFTDYASTSGNIISINTGTNPASDGKVYEITRRRDCIALNNFARISNVHTIGNILDDGGIRVKDNSEIIDCLIEWGNNHNVFMGVNGTLSGSILRYNFFDQPPGTPTLFVAFKNVGDTDADITIEDSTFIAGRPSSASYVDTIGVYCHSGDTVGFGDFNLSNCTFSKVLTCGSAQAENLNLVDCTGDPIGNIVSNSHIANNNITRGTYAINGAIWVPAGGTTSTLRGVRIRDDVGEILFQMLFTSNWDVQYCTITIGSSASSIPNDKVFDIAGNATGTLILRNNIVYGITKCITSSSTNITLDASNNIYFRPSFTAAFNWPTVGGNITLAQWKTATGQDANSVFGNPLIADADNGNFTSSNPNAAILNAGAEYYNP
jgi:hypothetical protein